MKLSRFSRSMVIGVTGFLGSVVLRLDAQEVIPNETERRAVTTSAVPIDSLHRGERLNGDGVTAVFANALQDQLQSILPIETSTGRQVTLSVSASNNGYLLSKASEIESYESGRLMARLGPDETVPAQVVMVEKDSDLALIKIDAKTVPVQWGASSSLKSGFWVAAVGSEDIGVRVGIVSTPLRSIEREGGFIGVRLKSRSETEASGALVVHVSKFSGAEQAGIKSGDVILSVAGKRISDPGSVTSIVTGFDADEVVAITIERRDDDGNPVNLEFNVRLSYRRETLDDVDRNMMLSGATSNRRAGFENVIQHDIPLHPEAMGGALFTLDGKAVGINIARRDRVTTFALPSEIAQRVARNMIAAHMEPAPSRESSSEPVPKK